MNKALPVMGAASCPLGIEPRKPLRFLQMRFLRLKGPSRWSEGRSPGTRCRTAMSPVGVKLQPLNVSIDMRSRRFVKWLALAAGIGLSYRYVWWLGANAWCPDPSVRVTVEGKPVSARALVSPCGDLWVEFESGTIHRYTIRSGHHSSELGLGASFKDYGFFALPAGSWFGVTVDARSPKTEHDPKLRSDEQGIHFVAMDGKQVSLTRR